MYHDSRYLGLIVEIKKVSRFNFVSTVLILLDLLQQRTRHLFLLLVCVKHQKHALATGQRSVDLFNLPLCFSFNMIKFLVHPEKLFLKLGRLA